MARIILLQLMLFATPFLVWAGWVLVMRRRRAAGVFDDAPLAALIIAGVLLCVAALFAMALTGGAEPGGTYVPPRYEDGRIVPGHVTPAEPRGGMAAPASQPAGR